MGNTTPKIRLFCRLSHALLVSNAVCLPTTHAAAEYIENERPAAGSIEQTVDPMEFSFLKPRLRKRFERLRDVFREGQLDLHLRNYYFDRYRKQSTDSEAWAQGGDLGYQTGWWKNRLRLGTTLYTSQKLYGPEDSDGTLLLKPGQKSFTVLGEAYLEAQPAEHISLKVYRQRFDLPYINEQDNRMVPNTFEAVSLIDTGGERFVYGVGQVERIKQRNATQFVSMTEAAGIKGSHKGVSVAGFRYQFADGTNIGAVSQYGWDFMNTFYAGATTRFRPSTQWGFQLSLQYTDQRAIGDELGGDFDTHAYGIKGAASYLGMVATAAYTSTANNAGIRSPWGGKPSYLSLMVEDFDRAGEDAWLVGLSTDFSRFGDNGFSAFINYAKGSTPDKGRLASPDQSELDMTLDYRFRESAFDGLWIRLRSARVDRDGSSGNDIRDFRAIVNYDVSVF